MKPQKAPLWKKLGAGAGALAILGGSIAVGTGMASADDHAPARDGVIAVQAAQSTVDETNDATADSGTGDEAGDRSERRGKSDRGEPGQRLQQFVDDGTITQDQADAIVARLSEQRAARMAERAEARAERGADGMPGEGRKGHRGGPDGHRASGGPGPFGTTVLELLDIEPLELRNALASGQSLADVAEANGVSRDELVAALLADVDARLDAAVEADKIDAEDAAEMRSTAEARIGEVVDTPFSERDSHRGHRRGHKGHDHDTDDDTDDGTA